MNEKLGQAEMFVLDFVIMYGNCELTAFTIKSSRKSADFVKINLFLHSRFFIRKSYFSDNDIQNDTQNDTQNDVVNVRSKCRRKCHRKCRRNASVQIKVPIGKWWNKK